MILGGDSKSISEVLRNLIKKRHWEEPLLLAQVREHWAEWVGRAIAAETERIDLRKNILYIKMKSSVARNALSLQKSDIIQRIQEELETTQISDVRLM